MLPCLLPTIMNEYASMENLLHAITAQSLVEPAPLVPGTYLPPNILEILDHGNLLPSTHEETYGGEGSTDHPRSDERFCTLEVFFENKKLAITPASGELKPLKLT